MATITDYASLVQAISDFTQRSGISTYADYFIQGGEDRIYRLLLDMNEGRGVRWMEAPLDVTIDATSGQAPIPTDMVSLRTAYVVANSGNSELRVAEPSWIYETFPQRSGGGIPQYIARGAQAVFTGTITAGILAITKATSGLPGIGQPLFGAGVQDGTTLTGITYLADSTFTADSGSVTTSTSGIEWTVSPTQTRASGPLTSGGFIFGPFPDSAYRIQGTYYRRTDALSSSNTETWMTAEMPLTLLAACMIEASKFLRDPQAAQLWEAEMEQRVQAIVLSDKADRFGNAPLVCRASDPLAPGW